ncbi:MAG: hypothetical protein ABL983_00935 [Nitrospira sp.]
MGQTILIKKDWTRQQVLDAHEVGGRPKGRLAGGHVYDLAAQKKIITLCSDCTHKFNPAKVGFRKEKEFPFVDATCDGCSAKQQKCSMYIFDELYTQVRSTAEERRAWAQSKAKRMKQGYL